MSVQEKLLTIDEYWEISQLPENENRRLELEEGVMCEMAPSSKLNTIIAMRIGRLLGNHVDHHKLGYVTGADGGFVLGPNTVRIPDVAYISKARVPELEEPLFQAAPDLAVEVISPGETGRKVLEKAQAYLQAGTQLVWAVYPEDEVVDIYRLADDDSVNVKTIEKDGTLDGEKVLPDFSLPVKDIFPE